MSTSTLVVDRAAATWLGRLVDYVELSKPRIAGLVSLSVGVAYCLAAGGQPDPWGLAHVVVGTLLVAASASALNQWLEWERDAVMDRTARRPLPSGRLGSAETLCFVAAGLLAGTVYLWLCSGWQPAAWAALTWISYVGMYTPLKTRSWWNTAVGAVAGGMPILIGWSAGGAYDLRAAGLFLLLFLWQFPHFMAIAWLYRDQYERAGMQMLPVVDPSGRRAGQHAVLAATVMIPVSLLPAGTAGDGSLVLYGLAAAALGLHQLAAALAFSRCRQVRTARALLRTTLVYLPAMLLLMLLVGWL
jgi:protoheme IX farnesyltransferase